MQNKRGSLLEVIVSTALGFGIALLTQTLVFPLYGFHATHAQNAQITVIFAAVSVVRGYIVRRFFNYLSSKDK